MTDLCKDAGLLNRGFDLSATRGVEGEWLLDEQMFASFGGFDCELDMLTGGASNVDGLHIAGS
jgi:hypothetical protein